MTLSELLRHEAALRGGDRPASGRQVSELEPAVGVSRAEPGRSRLRRCRPYLSAPYWRIGIGRGDQSANRRCALDLLAAPSTREIGTAAAERSADASAAATRTRAALPRPVCALPLRKAGTRGAGQHEGHQDHDDRTDANGEQHVHNVFDVARGQGVVSDLLKT